MKHYNFKQPYPSQQSAGIRGNKKLTRNPCTQKNKKVQFRRKAHHSEGQMTQSEAKQLC